MYSRIHVKKSFSLCLTWGKTVFSNTLYIIYLSYFHIQERMKKLSFQYMTCYQKVNLSQSVSENISLAECRPPFYIVVHNLVGAAI